MSFESLGLAAPILSALQKAGFTEPTPVQTSSIPKALEGHDLMVSAQTGSGKTAAFMLPALNRIVANPSKQRGVSVLVLAPTRELAMQVGEAAKTYASNCRDLRVAVIVGGMPYGAQLKALSRRVDVLVATPGRLMDHIQAKRVKLDTVHTLVLDEADRMLDMGFIEDIESIVARTPSDRQTLLFSATLDGTVAQLASKMMNKPLSIEVSGQKQKHENITQALLYADNTHHKEQLLDHLLRDATLDQAIIFTATKRGADELADRLCEEGFSAGALHGDMNQRQRTRTLGLLQRGRLRVLVATDVAARGIDVQGISHAINYDLPMQAEDYTHRIGRTGRAGKDGLAFTLANVSERHKVRRIEHFIGQPIPVEVIPGLEPTKTVRPTFKSRKGGGAGAGSRRRPSFNSGAPKAAGEFRDSRPARPNGNDTRPAARGDSRPDFRAPAENGGASAKPRRDRSGKPAARPTGGRPGNFAGKKSGPRSGASRAAR
ncbi:MAG TPA: DEAD/DEAH box helicase [Alcaligenaceae bacterium]|nr:DEAD/DEAH box helicase [Alcaligenaceae bacterium]